MKKYNKLFVGALLVFLLVVFSAINTKEVAVNFGFGQVSSPLIFVILGSTLLGCLIVLIFTVSTSWTQRRELKKLRNVQATFESEKAAELAVKDEKIAELEAQVALGLPEPTATLSEEHQAESPLTSETTLTD